jgi:hypothetical protein
VKYRKKPVVVDAMQWDGYGHDLIGWLMAGEIDYVVFQMRLRIRTLKGNMDAELGDWIIKGVKGEFYLCKPDIFEATYEPLEDPK